MDRETRKKVEDLIKDSEGIIVATDKGAYVAGKKIHILSVLCCLNKELLNYFDKEELLMALDISEKDPVTLLKEALDNMKEMLDNMEEEE